MSLKIETSFTNVTFKTPRYLKRHKIAVHDKVHNRIEPKCDPCNKKFLNDDYLTVHMTQFHLKVEMNDD